MRSEVPGGKGALVVPPGGTQPATPGALVAAAGAAASPHIEHLNVSRNSHMHIGPQFVSVTQNVHQDRVVKGRLLGLVLEARGGGGTRRLRCGVAVFVCWALVVAVALALYVCRLAFAARPHRLDLEEGAWHVVKAWARNTTRGERVACAAAVGVLVLCACAAAVLAAPRPEPPPPDLAPHEWNITRRMWLASPARDEEPWEDSFLPLRLVVVQHTAGAQCHTFADCAAAMRNLQAYYYKEFQYDVPYNYVVGNEARVYEGRGSAAVGAHTRGYNRCALGLAFTGDYRGGVGGALPTQQQMKHAQRLLAAGEAAGWLHPRALVLAARDVQATESPGDTLYAALRNWPQAPAEPAHFRDRSCEDIYAELRALYP